MADITVNEALPVVRNLAGRKADAFVRRCRLPIDEREDVASQLILIFLKRWPKFDRERASVQTFASRIMDHELASILRYRLAGRRRHIACGEFARDKDDTDFEEGFLAGLSATPRTLAEQRHFWLDVERVLVPLPRVLLETVYALCGNTPSELSRSHGRSRATIYRRMRHIREALLVAGIGTDYFAIRGASNEYAPCQSRLVPVFRAPDDLTEYDQWVLWRFESSTKVPYSTAGRRASSTDPASWCSYDEALDAWHWNSGRWTGIGFVFHESDPFVGIDLDDPLDEHANPKPWARGIVERFADTYCEISPSEHGLKLWCRGTLPTNVGKVVVGDGGIEMYSRARFFTVTGRSFRGAPLHVENHASDALELHAALTRAHGRWKHQPGANGKIPCGRQHYTLVSIAGTLARRGVCPEAIEGCLLVVNARQCERPGPPVNIKQIARSSSLWIGRREAPGS